MKIHQILQLPQDQKSFCINLPGQSDDDIENKRSTITYQIIKGINKNGKQIIPSNFNKKIINSSIYIPENIEQIKKNSYFENCDKVDTIRFSNNSKLTKIEQDAFSKCNNLSTVINLPKSDFSEFEKTLKIYKK